MQVNCIVLILRIGKELSISQAGPLTFPQPLHWALILIDTALFIGIIEHGMQGKIEPGSMQLQLRTVLAKRKMLRVPELSPGHAGIAGLLFS